MGVRILTDIDTANNPIKNLRFDTRANDPASPSTGQVWFNTAESKFRFFDGTSKQTIESGSVHVENETLFITTPE